MKKIIQKSLPGLIKFLERLQKKLTPINLIEDDKAYHALSPVRNADQVDEYIQALDWAIKRREENDILNIAITGPYGSGKSSILKTYIERHQDQGLHFLPISLATFKEDSTVAPVQDSANKPAGGENTSGKENLLRQIELSILQQIFYFEEDKKIPDSRFKKIRSVSQGELVMNSARIILLGLAVVGFFFLKPLFEQLHVTTSERLSTSIKWSSLLILTVGLCSIVYKSIRTITSVSISKLKLQNAEIEIGKNISKSALNNHLDEILYFFEVTSYNVVIIEDLDRFEQTEIFTKLREINQLINKSKKVNRKVAFIYAVKDEMFQDKDRTKFFDFIIPIIPVINSSNSSEKLKRIVSDYKYKISESLIDDIALFIDDMRLLYNVMNEYRVYQLKLGEKLDQEKLMGMVVYKNIHPRDFVDLANRTGFLYNIFGKYNDHINAYIANADTKIADLRKSMETLNRLQIRSIRELRMLYILNLYARLNEPNSLRLGGGRTFSLLQAVEDEYFNVIMTNQAYYSNRYTHNQPLGIEFSNIEEAVDSEWSYRDREAQITEWNKNQGNTIKEKITALEEEKMNARHLKIKDLVSAGSVEIDATIPMGQLTSILLRNGYIDEDYQDYISIFYAESITREDRQFLLDVKQQSTPIFDHRLAKIHNLLPKLRFTDFKTESILNFDLIDYLLQQGIKQVELTEVFRLLKKESANAVRFMDLFIDRTDNLPKFVRLLVLHWPGVWDFIKVRSNFPDERVYQYCRLIVEHCDLDEIKKVADAPDFRLYLENDEKFLFIISDRKKIRRLVDLLELKLSVIDDARAPEDLMEHVYVENHYALNKTMIQLMLKRNGNVEESNLYQRHYHTVLQSRCGPLIGYVKKNMEQYVVNVYLLLPNVQDEPEDDFLELLNTEVLSDEIKTRVVEKTSTIVTNIDKILNPVLAEHLLKVDRIVPTWHNVMMHYASKGNQIDKALTDFLNKEENAMQLSKMPMEQLKDEILADVKDAFEADLLELKDLHDEPYIMLLKSIHYQYDSLDLTNLSEKKVSGLLDTPILTLSEENYSLINQYFPNFKTKFLKRRMADLLTKIPTFPLTPGDLTAMFLDPEIDVPDLVKLIAAFDRERLIGSDLLKEGIGGFLLAHRAASPEIDAGILIKVLVTPWNQDQRISLFASRIETFTTGQVDEFLASLKDPYPQLATIGQVVKLPNNETNHLLANALARIKYVMLEQIKQKELDLVRQEVQA